MNKTAIVILRWGLAFVFFYAAVSSLLNPQDWIGFLPPWFPTFVSAKTMLSIFSVYEIVLAALLFSGKKLWQVSLLSAITLAGITVLNLGLLEITFRDVGLAMSALALYELARQNQKKNGGASGRS